MLGGIKISSATDVSNKFNGRPFHPPSNVHIPAAVGKYFQSKHSRCVRIC